MKKLVSLLLFLAVVSWGTAGAGVTEITTDSSFVWSWETAENGKVWKIAVPCSVFSAAAGGTDSLVTWAIDISKYRGVAVGYYCDTVASDAAPALCSLKIGYEQSFIRADSGFVTPYAHSTIENIYSDTSATFAVKDIYPSAATYIRFYVYALAGHDISPNGKLYLFIYLSNSPMSYIKQGGIGFFTDIRIRSPSYGTLGPKWFHIFVTDNGDTIHFKWEGGGPDRRTVWNNPVHFHDHLRTFGVLHVDGAVTWGEPKGVTLKADTLVLRVGSDGVMHKIDCSNATVTLSCIDDSIGGAGVEGRYVMLRLKNTNDTLVIDHDDGADENIYLGHDDTLFGTADRAFFIQDGLDRFSGFVTKRVGTRPSGIHYDYGVFNDSVHTALLRATDSVLTALARVTDSLIVFHVQADSLVAASWLSAPESLTVGLVRSDSVGIVPYLSATDSVLTDRIIIADSMNVPRIIISDSINVARSSHDVFSLGSPTQVTISAADSILFTTSSMMLEEASGALDSLAIIGGGFEGDILIVRPATVATIVIEHDATGGNILCSADITLGTISDYVMFMKRGTDWVRISSADNE